MGRRRMERLPAEMVFKDSPGVNHVSADQPDEHQLPSGPAGWLTW